MNSQKTLPGSKIYLQPVLDQINVFNMPADPKFVNNLSWDVAALENGNRVVIHNDIAYLYDGKSNKLLAECKFTNEHGYRRTIIVSENKIFLVSSTYTIQLDPETMTLKHEYDYSGHPPVIVSASEIAYWQGGGSAYISSNKSQAKDKIQLNNPEEGRALSIKKLANNDLLVISHEEDSKNHEKNLSPTQKFLMQIWRQSNNEWKNIRSMTFNIPNALRYEVLYPTDDQMLILCGKRNELEIVPVDLDQFNVKAHWKISCGVGNSEFFKNINLPGRPWNSTYDPRTVLFYKQNLGDKKIFNLYSLDIQTRSLKKFKLDNTQYNINKICASSPGEISLGGVKKDFRDLEILSFHIDIMKIPATMAVPISEKIMNDILSTTKILRNLGSIVIDYYGYDFPQDPEEVKEHLLEDEKELQLRNKIREDIVKDIEKKELEQETRKIACLEKIKEKLSEAKLGLKDSNESVRIKAKAMYDKINSILNAKIVSVESWISRIEALDINNNVQVSTKKTI